MRQALVGVEFVQHPTAGQLGIQFDALVERHQFVVCAVQRAERRTAYRRYLTLI